MKVSEALQVKKGMPLDELEGIVKNVYPMEQKEWGTQQNIYVTDGTLTILVQLGGCEEVKEDAVGQRFYAIAWNSPKHGFTGLKMNEYTNKAGKVVKQVKATKTAKIQIGNTLPAITSNNVVNNTHNHNTSLTKPTEQPKSEPQKSQFVQKVDYDGVKNRSMAISYAKDLACDGKIQLDELFDVAEAIHTYIVNGLVVAQESHDIRERDAQITAEDGIVDALNNDDDEIPF